MVYSNQLEEQDIEVTDAYSLYLKTLENFDNLLDAGLITSEQYDEMVRYATEVELPAYLADELGIDLDDDGTEIDYNEGMNVAEFSAPTRFSAALLELGEAAGFEDIEEYIYTLAEVSGVDPDDIAACIEGEIEPDDDFVVAVADAMELPDEYGVDLLAAAYEARGEDLYAELDDEDEEYEDDEDTDEELEEVAYSVANLENRVAEFEIAEAVRNRLAEIEDLVEVGLEERWLTPNKARELLGNFNREEDRVAAFSQMAVSNGVDLDTQLFALEYALNLDKNAGPVAQFGAYVTETYEATNEDAELVAQARRNMLARQNQFGI